MKQNVIGCPVNSKCLQMGQRKCPDYSLRSLEYIVKVAIVSHIALCTFHIQSSSLRRKPAIRVKASGHSGKTLCV